MTEKDFPQNMDKNLAIYQTKDGAIQLKEDTKHETFWAKLEDISKIFKRDKSVISRHIKNIFKEEELEKKEVIAKYATTASDGKTYQVNFYNLDLIISVGYRVNSKTATQFRKWATKTLKQHITKGFTINPKKIQTNYQEFLKTVEDLKKLSTDNQQIKSQDILELIKIFARTWFSLESYDKQKFPNAQFHKQSISLQVEDLHKAISQLKQELIQKKEATELFAQEKTTGNFSGIFGNIFQSAFGEDVYPSIEEKSAHLLYFIIKNHPFNDGNKRTAAFSFIWFLQKSGFHFQAKITPETLTALTLLIAESNPKDKEKMIGIVLLLLQS